MNDAILMSSGADDIDFMIHGLIPLKIFGQEVWITTSHVCILIVMLIMLIFAFAANRKMKHATEVPDGFQNILELLVETVTSRKKFLRICGEEKPKEVVKSRLMKLDSSHIQYILECLKENSTQIRNIKQYLLATLYNAPVTVDSYYSAQVRHEFGWGGRVDKN